MPLLADSQYVSEFTQFMQSYLQQNPDVAAGQVEGRGLLWDKAPIDLDERARNNASRVEQKPYPYQPD
ncbi:DUF3460 family protein [Chitinilyticum litopenaei]|uniref:DUF3460 family protein n=1 Tax=Chitinilyticum litopenaei TaxID=1121276 RepID=UPI00041FAA61|nr:DUF3460 family protein [Chitinilyticum litopenaei]